MTDRLSQVKANWKLATSRKGYQNTLGKIFISESDILSNIELNIESAIHTFCGKNGAGKTNILKEIFNALKNESEVSYVEVYSKSDRSTKIYGAGNETFENVYFLDPAEDSINIRKIISSDNSFREDYILDESISEIMLDVINDIKKILCSDISNIGVIEISGKLDNDEVFPFFILEKNGCKYDSFDMGQGEHKVLYLIWKLLTIRNNSIILLEEPEAFLCAKSQEYLMDYIVSIVIKKKLHLIISTHSDSIIKNQSLTNCSIVRKNKDDKSELTCQVRKSQYLGALGLIAPRIGVIFVEDRFAKLFIEEIFRGFHSSLINEYYIDFLNGESHIIETSRHYDSSSLNLIPVLDADQKGKVDQNELLLPVTFLPSVTNEAPEKEIIDFIRSNVIEFSDFIQNPDLIAVSKRVHSNFHDWCKDVARELDDEMYSYELEKKAIRFWIDKNNELAKLFLLYIENYKLKLSGELSSSNEWLYVSYLDISLPITNLSNDTYKLDRWLGKKVNFQFSSLEGDIKAMLSL